MPFFGNFGVIIRCSSAAVVQLKYLFQHTSQTLLNKTNACIQILLRFTLQSRAVKLFSNFFNAPFHKYIKRSEFMGVLRAEVTPGLWGTL